MRRRVLSYGLLALAATAGGLALNRLLDRPAETALSWVPAGALGAMSIDLVPAPDQILAFKSIDDMLASAPGSKDLDLKGNLIGSILHEFAGAPDLKPLGDQIDRSIAFAALPKRDRKPGAGPTDELEGIALMPVRDAAAVAAFLRTGKPVTVEGVPLATFKTKGGDTVYLFQKDAVVIGATTAWPVAEAAKVAMGQAPSLAATPAFAAARARALPSANLMVFTAPEIAKGKEWTVASMTIRDTGIEIAAEGQTDDKDLIKAGSLVPLGRGVLDALPRGAYGFFATAQPGQAMALAGGFLEEPAKGMKEEMGIDMQEDLVPALSGNSVVAFYPSFGPDAGLDVLMVQDDANGADPAALARKLEKAIGEKIAEDDQKAAAAWKVDVSREGAQASRLGDEPSVEMEKGLQRAEKSFFRPLTISRGKTVAWATVGRSLIFATSQSLLDRAILLRRNPSADMGLASDPALGVRSAEAADGQFALAISMKRLSEGLRNTIDPSHMGVEAAKMYRKSLSLYDNVTEPLAIRAQIGPDGHYKGYVSIPFDWTKLPGFFK